MELLIEAAKKTRAWEGGGAGGKVIKGSILDFLFEERMKNGWKNGALGYLVENFSRSLSIFVKCFFLAQNILKKFFFLHSKRKAI